MMMHTRPENKQPPERRIFSPFPNFITQKNYNRYKLYNALINNILQITPLFSNKILRIR